MAEGAKEDGELIGTKVAFFKGATHKYMQNLKLFHCPGASVSECS